VRLLVIGQTYSRRAAQQKFVALKAQAPEIELRVVVPDRPPGWGIGAVETAEVSSNLAAETIVLRRVWGSGNPTYGFSPPQLARTLYDFRADHIHIEEDFHSFVGVESVLLASLCNHRATVSFFTWDNLLQSRRFPLNQLKHALGRISLSRADMVICGNAEAQSLLRARGYEGPSTVLPQVGLDPQAYEGLPPRGLVDRFRSPPFEVVIGYFGRLVPEKGVRLLLESLESLKDIPWKVVIMGSGPLEAEIRGQWQKRLGSRLTCLSAVPPAAVPEYLKCLDVFVLPSQTTRRWKEQFGLILAQAMLAGAACLGSSSGAIPEVLGTAGLIFEEGNVGELRSGLELLLSNPALRARLSRAGRERALAQFTNDAVAAGYLAVFRQFHPSGSRSVS
jgi:glycosyltransferase involved in cell wall biosynthesis